MECAGNTSAAVAGNKFRMQATTCLGAEKDVVSRFDPQHQRMVLIGDLVLVAPEPAARPDVVLQKPRLRLIQRGVAPNARRRVPVLQPPGGPGRARWNVSA
jgi:hypothetical protein